MVFCCNSQNQLRQSLFCFGLFLRKEETGKLMEEREKLKIGKKKNFFRNTFSPHIHSRRLGVIVAFNLNSFLTKVLHYQKLSHL